MYTHVFIVLSGIDSARYWFMLILPMHTNRLSYLVRLLFVTQIAFGYFGGNLNVSILLLAKQRSREQACTVPLFRRGGSRGPLIVDIVIRTLLCDGEERRIYSENVSMNSLHMPLSQNGVAAPKNALRLCIILIAP